MGALACKTKIIIDGSNAAALAETICEATRNLSDEQVNKLTDAAAYPVIQHLIAAEKALTQAQNSLLNAVGYDGPRP